MFRVLPLREAISLYFRNSFFDSESGVPATVPWVRIPPTPPKIHRNSDRIAVDFFYAPKPLKIRALKKSDLHW